MHNFKQLDAWNKGMDVAESIYLITSEFPQEERFGLVQQLRRAAVSVPSGIAEGSGRSTNPDFARFLDISMGSSFEIETQLLLSKRLQFGNREAIDMALVNIEHQQKLIYKLRQHILSQK